MDVSGDTRMRSDLVKLRDPCGSDNKTDGHSPSFSLFFSSSIQISPSFLPRKKSSISFFSSFPLSSNTTTAAALVAALSFLFSNGSKAHLLLFAQQTQPTVLSFPPARPVFQHHLHVVKSDEQDDVGHTDDDDDAGPFGVIRALNLQRYQHHRCIKELKEFLFEACTEEATKKKLKTYLERQAGDVGFLVSQRFANCPYKLVPPLYDALFVEIAWATEDEPTQELRDSCFKYYVLVTRIFESKTINQSKKNLNGDDDFSDSIIYIKPENEIFQELSPLSFTFALRVRLLTEEGRACTVLYLLLPWLLCDPIPIIILLPAAVWLCTFFHVHLSELAYHSHLLAATQLEQQPVVLSSHLTLLLIESIALASSTLMRMGVGRASLTPPATAVAIASITAFLVPNCLLQ
ncbi:uncharacterized protein LOC141826177 [Curcuma longa]|uniref:uncharacterized protein LOC141826177 n=1 Tax=Curcuma longa TaxID=136217 RepID=UPI003D9E5AD5